MEPCPMCGTPFDRLVTRYLCPSCRIKTVSCCDGDPLPPIHWESTDVHRG